jgi:hypothetical protein
MGFTKNLGWVSQFITATREGKVGINKVDPNTDLDINGDAIVTGSLVVTQGITGSLLGTATTASFTNVASLGGFIQGGNSFGSQATIGTNDNQSLALETSGSTRMFISSSGNVGIGTATPNFLLHSNSSGINSYMQFTSTTTGTTSSDGLIIGTGDAGDAIFLNRENTSIQFSTNNTERVRITGGGLVGIGTPSPTHLLTLYGTSQADIKFQNSGATRAYIWSNSSELAFNSLTSSPIKFYVDDSEKVRIAASGNVGIGTTSPTDQLHLSRGGSNYIAIDNTGSNYKTIIGSTGSGTKIYSRVLSTNGDAPMDLVVGQDSAIYINTSKNVGIGTTTPGHRLDVVGAGRFSSNIMARNFNNAIKSWSSNGAYNWATELLALAGYFDSAGWYKGFIRESNGAHYYGYQFDIHVGQIGYGGASSQFIVRNMTYAGGPWTGGCGASSFASIDNSGFTKQNSGCFDSLELFITKLG